MLPLVTQLEAPTMCRSKAEGGQRCFGHALQSYEKVRDQLLAEQASLPDTAQARAEQAKWSMAWDARDNESLNRARIMLASTEKGRALIEEWRKPGDNPDRRALEKMWGRNQDAIDDYLNRVVEHGKETAKVNEQVRRLNTSRLARFRVRAEALIEEFTGNWRANAGLVGTAATSAYRAWHSSGGAQAIYIGTAAVALGVVAYLAWKGTRYHRWEHARDAAQDTLPRRQAYAEGRERTTVKEIHARDVARGAVPPPPTPSAEAKASYRDSVRGHLARIA